MFKAILIGIALCLAPVSAFAQECLHGSSETAANRTRRQQAFQYAVKLNAAETGVTVGPVQPRPKYRPLNELPNLTQVPAGFDLQFHTDGVSYAFSLKDTRDACHYAIFSDQEKLVYEAIPSAGGLLLPLSTK